MPDENIDWSGIKVLTIFGQHDMNQHQGTVNTPLWTMDAARAVTVVNSNSPIQLRDNSSGQVLYIYGHNYNEPVPSILTTRDVSSFKVLLTHQMVSDRDYWHGSVNFSSANQVLRSHPYDLIVCGDNHNHFKASVRIANSQFSRYLINCGSLMRSTIAQKDHKPVVYVFDTITRSLEMIEIPIQPSDQVFSQERSITLRPDGSNMNPFVEEIRARRHGVGGMDFVEVLHHKMDHQQVDAATRELIEAHLATAFDEDEPHIDDDFFEED